MGYSLNFDSSSAYPTLAQANWFVLTFFCCILPVQRGWTWDTSTRSFSGIATAEVPTPAVEGDWAGWMGHKFVGPLTQVISGVESTRSGVNNGLYHFAGGQPGYTLFETKSARKLREGNCACFVISLFNHTSSAQSTTTGQYNYILWLRTLWRLRK